MSRQKKTGLALGVGAAPGMAHIGVIRALLENDIPIDCIAGTSIGALIGACYASQKDIDKVEKLFLEMNWKKFVQLMDTNIFMMSKGFIQGEKVKEFLRPLIGDVSFRDLKIPLAVIATDVNTGEEVIMQEGTVLDAVRASISMPVIFMPVKSGDRYLIDGGSVNPLPIDVVKKMRAEYIIASNIVPSPAKRESSIDSQHKKEDVKKHSLSGSIAARLREWGVELPQGEAAAADDMPDMFSVLLQAMYASEYIVVKEKLQSADLVITPATTHIEMLDFLRAKEAIDKGYIEASARLKDAAQT